MPLCLHLPSVLCENFCCWTAPGGNFADGWIFEGRLPRSLLPFDPVSRLFIGPFSSLPKQVEIGCVTFFVSSQNGEVILLDPLLLLLQSDALVSGEQQGPCTLQFPPGGGLHLVEGPGPVEGSSGQPPLRSQHSSSSFFLPPPPRSSFSFPFPSPPPPKKEGGPGPVCQSAGGGNVIVAPPTPHRKPNPSLCFSFLFSLSLSRPPFPAPLGEILFYFHAGEIRRAWRFRAAPHRSGAGAAALKGCGRPSTPPRDARSPRTRGR